MKKQTVIKVEYREIEDLVNKHLGFKDYEFVAVEECGNDSSHEFDVSKVDGKWFDQESHNDTISQWNAGKHVTFSNGDVLNELCIRGHIEPGTYIVHVSW